LLIRFDNSEASHDLKLFLIAESLEGCGYLHAKQAWSAICGHSGQVSRLDVSTKIHIKGNRLIRSQDYRYRFPSEAEDPLEMNGLFFLRYKVVHVCARMIYFDSMVGQ